MYLKKKNIIQAEKLFKKICISEKEHHAGFQGLAYVYYVFGEFEKAEWFMEQALKTAREFEKEGDLDQIVREEMEKNYCC